MSRNQIIDRERRWQVPVAVTAIAAALLGFAGGIVQVGALDGAETDAASLVARDANDGSFAAAVVLQSASWFFLAVPFAYLFLAAAARSERVNRILLGLFVIAPILLAVGSVLQWRGYADVADQFVEERPSLEAEAEAAEEEAAADGEATTEDKPSDGGQGESGKGQEQAGDDSGGAGAAPGAGGGADGQADEETADEEAEELVEERAEELIDDSSDLQTAGSIFLGGLFGMAVGVLYTCLQAMRVGLVTRFFGSLGMALAVAMIVFLGGLLPAVLLFTVALGFLILGRWPGGRPPAWEAGRAIPWPRPGEQPEDSGTVEGRGEEVEPQPGAGDDEPERPSASGPRRKRKRRR